MVFKGSVGRRAVAVKRLHRDFITLTAREVSILEEADDHPNVIQYFYHETRSNYIYIAIQLCPASLADIIERPEKFTEIVGTFDPKCTLHQITSGIWHLHGLKIIHRDIKPQNILVSSAKDGEHHRMLISLGARGPGTSDYMLRTLRSLVKFTWLLIGNNISGTFQM